MVCEGGPAACVEFPRGHRNQALCAGAFRITEAGSWGAPHLALKVLCVRHKFPVGPQFYTCVFISWCAMVPVGNVSAKGQAAALHGGPIYFMRRTAKGQERAPRTVTSMAHRTDHRTRCSWKGESPKKWPGLPGVRGPRAHLG